MTDEELIARLRLYGRSEVAVLEAADRIEALTAKLAKAVKVLEYYALEDVSAGFYDSLVARTALADIKGDTK